jgi:hypothetical protein
LSIIVKDNMRGLESTLKTYDGHTFTANDEILAKQAADMLNKHYPGHLWAVNVNSEGGVMLIKNFSISFLYGYTLHLDKLDVGLQKVMRAGGEILERAKMKRGAGNGDKAVYVEGLPDKHQPIPELGIIQ